MPPKKKTSGRSGQPTKTEKRISDEVIANAKATGLMPHEILLRVARGESIVVRRLIIYKYKSGIRRGEEKSREWIGEEYFPTLSEQLECARSAAPYFAPRLTTQTVKTDENTALALTEVMKQLSGKLPG